MSTQTPISGLTALGAAPASNDLLPVVDVSDTDQASTGTLKKMTVENLFTSPSIASPSLTGTVTVSTILSVQGASAHAIINSTGGTSPSLFLQNSGTTGGGFDSNGTDVVRVLNSSSLPIATFSAGTLTLPSSLTVTSGGVTVTAGGVTVTAGGIGVTAGGITVSAGKVTAAASTTGGASLNLPSGTAPTSPVNGDVWFDGGAVKIQISGATKTFTVA